MPSSTIPTRLPLALLCAGALAACAAAAPYRSETTAPTVSYIYDGSDEGLAEVSADAESYCRDEYGRGADLLRKERQNEDEVKAVFEC